MHGLEYKYTLVVFLITSAFPQPSVQLRHQIDKLQIVQKFEYDEKVPAVECVCINN